MASYDAVSTIHEYLLSGLMIAPPIILYLGGWHAVFYLFGVLGFAWGTW